MIPSVAYTDPEVAWVGLTETEAKENGVDYEKAYDAVDKEKAADSVDMDKVKEALATDGE